MYIRYVKICIIFCSMLVAFPGLSSAANVKVSKIPVAKSQGAGQRHCSCSRSVNRACDFQFLYFYFRSVTADANSRKESVMSGGRKIVWLGVIVFLGICMALAIHGAPAIYGSSI